MTRPVFDRQSQESQSTCSTIRKKREPGGSNPPDKRESTMQGNHPLEANSNKLVPSLSEQKSQEPATEIQAKEESEPLISASGEQEELYDVYTIPGGVVILRADETVIETTVAGTTTTEGNTEQKQTPEQGTEPLRTEKERTRLAIL